MPELPEVETVARQLAPLLTGRVLNAVRVKDSKLHSGRGLKLATRNLARWCIKDVRRNGKQIVLELSHRGRPSRWLVIHLRMTGRLIYSAPPDVPDEQHLRCSFALDCGELTFIDPRRFGTVDLLTDQASFASAGLDPVNDSLTAAVLAGLLAGSRQDIKSWLLRQDKLVGMGNIYACEALYASGIDPRRRAGEFSDAEIKDLAWAIRSLLRSAIRHCGTTFSDFQDSRGKIGGFQRYLKVYGRSGDSCTRCHGEIVRIVQQQRSTFFCPACQQ